MRSFTEQELRTAKAALTEDLFWIDYPYKEDLPIYSSLMKEAVSLMIELQDNEAMRDKDFDMITWFFAKNGVDITK